MHTLSKYDTYQAGRMVLLNDGWVSFKYLVDSIELTGLKIENIQALRKPIHDIKKYDCKISACYYL